MLGFFSDVEKEQLEALKKNLISPKEYFFHRYKDFADFKKINERMWYWQWHYLYSAVTLFANTLKHLGKAFYSLLSLQFAVAGERFTEAGKSLGAAFVKLSLDIGLLCLHLARFLSLFITTFFPWFSYVACFIAGSFIIFGIPTLGLAGIFLGLGVCAIGVVILCGSLLMKNKNPCPSLDIKLQIVDFDAYETLLDEVQEERNQIQLRLKQISETSVPIELQSMPRSGGAFFVKKELSANTQERVEVTELVTQLFISLKEYPGFSRERAKEEPHYIAELYIELMEHHRKVKLLAEEYFRRVGIAELSKEENASILAIF